MSRISRRLFGCAGLAAAASLTACAETFPIGDNEGNSRSANRSGGTLGHPDYREVYGSYRGEEFPIPAVDYHAINQTFLRQEVTYLGPEEPGTIVVDPSSHFLFFVEPDRRATRYGVGVGREGFDWSGQALINMHRSWPDWVPPKDMVERAPEIQAKLEPTARGLGVRGGPKSPLGARAMYLFAEGRDLGYRIHGTIEPWTIGSNVSSGCIRMINQDVIHLYGRAPDGTQVVVLG